MEGVTIYQALRAKESYLYAAMSLPQKSCGQGIWMTSATQLRGVVRGHFTNVQEKLLSWCFPCHQKTGWKRGWEMLWQKSPWLQGQIFIFHCVPLEFCRF